MHFLSSRLNERTIFPINNTIASPSNPHASLRTQRRDASTSLCNHNDSAAPIFAIFVLAPHLQRRLHLGRVSVIFTSSPPGTCLSNLHGSAKMVHTACGTACHLTHFPGPRSSHFQPHPSERFPKKPIFAQASAPPPRTFRFRFLMSRPCHRQRPGPIIQNKL